MNNSIFNEFKIIVKNKYFYLSFICIIILTLFCNIGIYYHFPNLIPILQDSIDPLSNKIPNKHSLELLIGLFTVFIVFFTFVQFSYSSKSTPTSIIRKYIIEANETMSYIGLQGGFISVLSYFSFFNLENIYVVNYFLSISYLILSAVISVVYFYWLSNHIQATNVFRLILKKINIKKLVSLEKQYDKQLNKFNLECDDIKIKNPRLKLKSDILFINENDIVLITNKKGIVKNINIFKLVQIFQEYLNNIDAFLINVKIGDEIPYYKVLPGIEPKTLLFAIIPKITNDDEINNNITKIFNANQSKIEKLFILDKGTLFKNNSTYINHLMNFYLFSTINNKEDLEDLIDELIAFIIKGIEKNSDYVNKVGLVEKLFLKLTKSVYEKLNSNELSFQMINGILSILYALNKLSIEYKSLHIMNDIFRLMNNLFLYIILKGLNFRFYLFTLIQYVKEITLQTIANSSLDDFNSKDKEFYIPIIYASIDQATITYFHLLKHFDRIGIDEGEDILIHNGRDLINFLFPLKYWEPFDSLKNHEVSGRRLNEITEYFGKNIILLSIHTFNLIYQNKLPKHFLNKVSFALINNSYNTYNHDVNNLEFINKVFYEINFVDPGSSIYSLLFEERGINNSDTSFNINSAKFWIAYSFYLVEINKDNNEIKKYFVPQKTPSKYSENIILEGILRTLERLNYKWYSVALKIDLGKIEYLVGEYKRHLRNLLNDSKDNNNIIY